jgi:hypothetical protein
VPAVFQSEGQALSFIRSRIAKGTVVNAEAANQWNELQARFEMKRVDHAEAYSMDVKLKRGTFPATFFIAALVAIGAEAVKLEDI